MTIRDHLRSYAMRWLDLNTSEYVRTLNDRLKKSDIEINRLRIALAEAEGARSALAKQVEAVRIENRDLALRTTLTDVAPLETIDRALEFLRAIRPGESIPNVKAYLTSAMDILEHGQRLLWKTRPLIEAQRRAG